MAENKINYNKTILKNYQKIYPNLEKFSYDELNDSLVYEGNFIKLNGYGLSRIDPIFFELNPDDIFTYFKDGFYQARDINGQIENYLNQFIITEDVEQSINSYVKQYVDKLNIYARNAQFFDRHYQNESIKYFILDFLKAKKIIENAIKFANPNVYNAYLIISKAYNNLMSGNSKNQSESMKKGMSLSRVKPGFSGYQEFDKNLEYLNELNKKDKMSMSGFTSMLLIISTTISIGMFLALRLLG